ncbi:SEC-C domain-containing protein [Stigmatella sp. ncwal1]|uniref:SEC-C domain-containing protein n=1 Tax=Stigmatella ashevillensis TaxID=2995309 RepID=A0ABT5DHJ4_9BACT|nr:SEC-C domain-containing protein [Stigmatella ashevillena]MDC0712610.1 SEC-C domain-containing protein [Stigmatella ashevillena]
MSKPGRNAPCPCGSGKKYKVCHASEDRARAASPPAAAHPLTGDLRAAMDLLGDPNLSRLSGALEHLGALLAEWGPTPGLRFDETAFDAHISKALEALAGTAEQEPARDKRELLVGTVRQLGTRAFLDTFRESVLKRAAEPGRSPEDKQALCVGALLASAQGRGSRFNPEDIPVLDVIFEVQFREWCSRHQELAHKLEALSRFAEEDLSAGAREALQKAKEGDVDALLQHVQSDPLLVERITREAQERSARVEAKLRDPASPPLFAPEEELWFTCVLWEPLRAVKAAATDATTRRAAVANLIRAVKAALDSELLEGLLSRLRAKAGDTTLDETTRAWFTDASIAVEAEPSRVVMAALFTASQEAQGRSAEEMVLLADLKAQPAWTAGDLEPYGQFLESTGLTAAAQRIRRCQEWLREHPLSLATENV